MALNTLAVVIAAYFGCGVIALLGFDIHTQRIRKKWRESSIQIQEKFAASGTLVGTKAVNVVLLFALWVFWPFVLIGAATKGENGKS
jgi:hypothetical protein